MRIMVTGGAGFIGSHICDLALARGHEVAALDDLSTGRRENLAADVPLYRVDIRDREATSRAFEDFRPQALCHQAAQASVSSSMNDPSADAAINVVGGLHVVEASIAAGCRLFAFASTGGAIYGEVPEGELASEDWTPRPASPYAIHKLTFERLLGVYEAQGKLDPVVIRYGNVFGPRQDPHGEAGVVAIFLQRLLSGDAIFVNARRSQGDSGCVRDYVHVRDVAQVNLAALEGNLKQRLLNVGTGVPTSTETLARMLREMTGSQSEVLYADPRPGDLERSVLSTRRWPSHLDVPATLKNGLKETVDWYKTAPRQRA